MVFSKSPMKFLRHWAPMGWSLPLHRIAAFVAWNQYLVFAGKQIDLSQLEEQQDGQGNHVSLKWFGHFTENSTKFWNACPPTSSQAKFYKVTYSFEKFLCSIYRRWGYKHAGSRTVLWHTQPSVPGRFASWETYPVSLTKAAISSELLEILLAVKLACCSRDVQ